MFKFHPHRKADTSFTNGALLVALGIRRAYLADTLSIPTGKLGEAITDLRKLKPEYVNVLLLHESRTDQLFVIGVQDPQHEMPEPVLVDTDTFAILGLETLPIETDAMLQKARLQAIDTGFAVVDLRDYVTFDGSLTCENISMIAMAGLLLEYPFIYHLSNGHQAGKSLSQVPLARFTFTVTIDQQSRVISQSTVPETTLEKVKDWQAMLQAARDTYAKRTDGFAGNVTLSIERNLLFDAVTL